jgi:hypothetical protein
MNNSSQRCTGPGGKVIFGTRQEAQAALPAFRRAHYGRGAVKRCSWADHYHLTKGLRGLKGKDLR